MQFTVHSTINDLGSPMALAERSEREMAVAATRRSCSLDARHSPIAFACVIVEWRRSCTMSEADFYHLLLPRMEEMCMYCKEGGVNGGALSIEYYMDSLPPGYRFQPTDEELVYYLTDKILGRPLPIVPIRDINLYNYNPQQLSQEYGLNEREREWYFFTLRDRKYPNGSRSSRKTADGFWKANGASNPIKSNNRTIGYKKTLVFWEGNARDGKTKTNWLMHEYTLELKNSLATSGEPGDMKLDWVLCKLKNDKLDPIKGRSNNNQGQQQGNFYFMKWFT